MTTDADLASNDRVRTRPIADGADRSGVLSGISAYLLWGFITIYWKALKEFAPLELIGMDNRFKIKSLSSKLCLGVITLGCLY